MHQKVGRTSKHNMTKAREPEATFVHMMFVSFV
jgi:hypothetical protein